MRNSVILAVMALLVAAPAVNAGDSQQVSGTYLLDLIPEVPLTTDQRSKNVCIITLGLRAIMSGDLNGTLDIIVTMNVKGACDDYMAEANIHGKGAFTGALGDRPGAFDASAVFWHHGDLTASGRVTIQHATADLAGLHGILHMEGLVGVGGDYHGEVHFAP